MGNSKELTSLSVFPSLFLRLCPSVSLSLSLSLSLSPFWKSLTKIDIGLRCWSEYLPAVLCERETVRPWVCFEFWRQELQEENLFFYIKAAGSRQPVIFGSHFVWGKNNGGHKSRPRKTTINRGKRHFLDSVWAVKLFAQLTELSWSDVRDTCVSSRHFSSRKKAQKITEYRDTPPLITFWKSERPKADLNLPR